MRPLVVLGAIGAVILALAAGMTLSAVISLIAEDGELAVWIGSITLSGAAGGGLVFATRGSLDDLRRSEGFAVVTGGWAASAVFGAVPFLLSGAIPSFTDAVFETMSGFTTTGASILTEIESLPPSLLFWRSLTHWIGGMGIIVLSLAILPFLGVGGMQLYRAEVPGPAPDRLKPRLQETAKLLWVVYFVLTAAEVLALILAGMEPLDALCHTFGTMGTGGFSTKNASIGHYTSSAVHWIIIVFMFLAGANFTLHFHFLRTGSLTHYWRDSEFRFYAMVTAGAVALTALLLGRGGFGPSWGVALRDAAFQVISIGTTTGYATADFEKWPFATHFLLLLLMVMGGCAGSTGGGIKAVRVLLLFRYARAELKRLLHPRGVIGVKYEGRTVPDTVVQNVLGLLFLYGCLFCCASFVLTLMKMDLVTASSATIACLSNIGPGLGDVGPAENYAWMPAAAKWLLSGCMLLGRLEIYTVLVLLAPEIWRR